MATTTPMGAPDPGSLASRFPTVAAQWHPTRNPSWHTAENTAGQSAQRAWWLCPNGHEWEEVVSQRTSTIPKWKNGDPAACRQCTTTPAGDAQVMHTFGCGHTKRVTVRNAQKNPPRCWDCEQPFHEARKREQRLAKKRADAQRKPTPKTPEQRQVQRRLVPALTRMMLVDRHGVSLPRSDMLAWAYGAADVDEVARWLDTLDIPHTVVESPVAVPGDLGPTYLVRVAWEHVPELERWAPSAVAKAHEVRERMRQEIDRGETVALRT